ncbi:exopolysaccharide biosynthesis protein [Salinisphaera sp.]|uniref:exopolysaccharide biosynthesis protein n=1 Tax=Salinisphaera sp. TaxID=1914330 RepID=UPI002D78EC16|nr:exopolysaccharide biosynthesis protein [Salinisphaera sp.]HET7313825.1 exopolysaccharide biosynthesis protein [Salinisphaera sp.]
MERGITLTTLLEILESSGTSERLTLGEVLATIGERGYAPLTLILALIAILPTGAVPGVPTVCGASIALVSIQLVFGKRCPWLPKKLRALSIRRTRYTRVAERVRPWTRRIDRLVKPRLPWLVEGAAARVLGLLFVVLALCMPPLEILPFAAAAPGGGIALISLGLAGRDGLWVLFGLIPAALGGWLIYGLVGL